MVGRDARRHRGRHAPRSGAASSTRRQLRWLGPEKGVVHLATAAIVNAVWDLWAKVEGKPLWKLLADMTPERARRVRRLPLHHRRAHARARRSSCCERQRAGRAAREAEMPRDGFPAYTTSAGWLGYDDDKIAGSCREAVAAGSTHVKMKVGRDLDDDVRRAAADPRGDRPERKLMMDANQVLGRGRGDRGDGAPRATSTPGGSRSRPAPTTCSATPPSRRADRARSASRPASTCQNRVIFKQLLQADAIDFCQVDACRLGGVNEVLAVLLLAAKFGVPVCPHAGGVGLCEYVQHLAVFDYIAVSGIAGRPRRRVRRPPARALRRARGRARGPLSRAACARLQRRDAAGVARRVRVPVRAGLDLRPRRGGGLAPWCPSRDRLPS